MVAMGGLISWIGIFSPCQPSARLTEAERRISGLWCLVGNVLLVMSGCLLSSRSGAPVRKAAVRLAGSVRVWRQSVETVKGYTGLCGQRSLDCSGFWIKGLR